MRLVVDDIVLPNISYLKVAHSFISDDFPNGQITIEYQNLENHERERMRCSQFEIFDDIDDGR